MTKPFPRRPLMNALDTSADPDIPHPGPKSQASPPLLVAYQVEEAPRLLLHTLTRCSALDDRVKRFITNWLIGYDEYLLRFLVDNYGPSVLAAADATTAEVYENMVDAFAAECDISESESFGRWTDRFGAWA
jgi:hypothetical protein